MISRDDIDAMMPDEDKDVKLDVLCAKVCASVNNGYGPSAELIGQMLDAIRDLRAEVNELRDNK